MAIANYTDDNGISWARITTNEDDAGYFWVNWREKGWDLANKTTTIEWACGVYCKYTFQNNAVRMDAFSINGVKVYGGGTYSNFQKETSHTIATGTLDVEHDADGTKTLSISKITGWLYLSHNYTAAAAEYQWVGLGITEAADFTDLQDSISITISNPFGYTVGLRMDCNIDSETDFFQENIVLGDNGVYTWDLSGVIEDLRKLCPSQECPVRLYVDTTIDGKAYSAYKDVTFTLVSDAVKPVVVVLCGLDNSGLPEAIRDEFDGKWIQSKTKVSILIEPEGQYGADIVSCYATMEDKTYKGERVDPEGGPEEEITTDVIKGSGDITITVRVEDTRGFYTEEQRAITVLSYSKPLVVPVGEETAILCYRSDGNGKRVGSSTSLWIKAAVSYHALGGKNECALQWRWKEASVPWTDAHTWATLVTKDDTYLVGGEFDLKTSYTVQLRAIDTIGEQDPKTFDIPTEDVPLHLGKGGKNVTVGSYCDYSEENTFRSTWKAIFEAGVDIVDGDSRIPLKEYIKSVIDEGG